MYPYESEAICRTIITDRIREAGHRRSPILRSPRPAIHPRLPSVQLSHAYG